MSFLSRPLALLAPTLFALATTVTTGCAGHLAPATIFSSAQNTDYLMTCAPQPSLPDGRRAIQAEYLGSGSDRLFVSCGVSKATATCAPGEVARVAMISDEVAAVFEGTQNPDGVWNIPVEPVGRTINLYRTCAASQPTIASTSPSVLTSFWGSL